MSTMTTPEIDQTDVSLRIATSQLHAPGSVGRNNLGNSPKRASYKGQEFYLLDEGQLSALLDEPLFGDWAQDTAATYAATPSAVLLALAVALEAGLGR
jgi:hypothetical protein